MSIHWKLERCHTIRKVWGVEPAVFEREPTEQLNKQCMAHLQQCLEDTYVVGLRNHLKGQGFANLKTKS